MAMIRPQDGLLLALPLLDAGVAAWRSPDRSARRAHIAAAAAMVAMAAVVFMPQLLVWKLLNGGFLVSGYGEEVDNLFRAPWSRLLPVLFSDLRGLFTWHPVFLLATAGLAWWRQRWLAGLMLAAFAVQWLVISSWHDWVQGDAFGARMFIVLTPVFALGLTVLVDQVWKNGWRRRLAWIGAFLILFNAFLAVQYRLALQTAEPALALSDLISGSD